MRAHLFTGWREDAVSAKRVGNCQLRAHEVANVGCSEPINSSWITPISNAAVVYSHVLSATGNCAVGYLINCATDDPELREKLWEEYRKYKKGQ